MGEAARRLLLLQMKQRSRWNSFLRAIRRCRLIAIQPAIEIAMYSFISIVAKFGHSSRYFHVNSFVSHYSLSSWLCKSAAFVPSLSKSLAMLPRIENSHYATCDKGCIQVHSIPIDFQSTSRRELVQYASIAQCEHTSSVPYHDFSALR